MMTNYYGLFPISFVLFAFQRVWPADATECIDDRLHWPEIQNCCRYESYFSDEASLKCFEIAYERLNIGSAETSLCFVECALQKMGVLKVNDVIEPEQYYPYLAKFDPAYREVVMNAIDSCASIQDDIRRDVQSMGSACSAFGTLFYMCMRQLTVSNCPADRWKSYHICDKIKQGVPMCG